MAIPTLAAYIDRLRSPQQSVLVTKVRPGGNTVRMSTYWLLASAPTGFALPPSTAVVPSRTLAGALAQAVPLGVLRLLAAELTIEIGLSNSGMLLVIDRLSHQGGLSGTTTGAQTTNLPTAALTRYTDGVGVMAAAEVHSVIGATQADLTVSYTNQAGVSKTSEATAFGGNALYNALGVFVPIPLASGDTGVRSVESATLSVSTGTAGNWGIVLFRVLAAIPLTRGKQVLAHALSILQAQEINANACLSLVDFALLNGHFNVNGTLYLSED